MDTAYRNQGLLALAALLVGGAGGYAAAQLTKAPERGAGVELSEHTARVEFDEAALAAALVQGIDARFEALLSGLAAAPLTATDAQREPAGGTREQAGDGNEDARLAAALAGIERVLTRGDRGHRGTDASTSGRWSIAAGSNAMGLDAFGAKGVRTALADGEEWAYNAWTSGLREQLLLATPADVVARLGWPQSTGMESGYAYWEFRIPDREIEWSRGTPLHAVTVYFQGSVVMSVEADLEVGD